MQIGERIKKLRKTEMLTQKEFAKSLGVSQGYIPSIEKGLKEPSGQLLLSISRAFGVNLEWLKEGKGEMYMPGGFTPKGKALVNEIQKRVVGEERKRYLSLRETGEVLNINVDRVPEDLNLPREFPGALHLLLEIFKEGNRKKIDAIMAQLQALKPEKLRKEEGE